MAKETWVEIKEGDIHDGDQVLFATIRNGYILPDDNGGLQRAKAALEKALEEIRRFEAVFTS